jgi:hypothetical protein
MQYYIYVLSRFTSKFAQKQLTEKESWYTVYGMCSAGLYELFFCMVNI